MPRLKNCPFCGSDNIYYPKERNWMCELSSGIDDYMDYHIECWNCKATISRREYADVFEAWNRRANENDE